MTIEEIIERDFNTTKDKKLLEPYIEQIMNNTWGVGNEQLLKSILALSKGSLEKFKSFFPINDPRDIIMEAQQES